MLLLYRLNVTVPVGLLPPDTAAVSCTPWPTVALAGNAVVAMLTAGLMVTGSAASVHFIHEGFSLCGTLVGWGVNSLAVAILGSSKTQAQDAAIKNAVAAYVAAASA